MKRLSVSLAAALLVLSGCGAHSSAAPSFSTTPVATPTPTAKPTRSAACTHGTPVYLVQPYASASALTSAYRPLIASLSRSLGCTVKFEIASSIRAELTAAARGQVTIAEFAGLGSGFALAGPHPAIAVVATYGSDFNGTPAAFISSVYDDPHFGEADLTALAGKRLALTTPGSLSGDFLPRAALAEAGVLAKVDLVYTGSHLQALRNLSCQARPQLRSVPCVKFDYAALNSRVMGPAAKKHEWDPGKYTQMWQSDPVPYTAIGVSTALPADVRTSLQAALLAVPATSVRGIARLIEFAPPRTGPGLVAIGVEAYCQDANLDLCDVIKTLKLTPEQVRPLVGEGL